MKYRAHKAKSTSIGRGLVTFHPSTNRFYAGDISKMDLEDGDDHIGHLLLADYNPDRKIHDGRYVFQAEVERAASRDLNQGLTTTPDIANITITQLLGELHFKMWREFYAVLGTTREPVPKLIGYAPILGKYRANEKVPEGIEADESASTYTRATFDLWKNVVDITATLEATIKGTFNPMSVDIEQAAGALTEVANEQCVTAIESFTAVAKGSWAAKTAGISDRDPIVDINTELNVLLPLHARPKIIATNSLVAGAYLGNTNVKGINMGTAAQLLGGLYPVQGFPGLQFLIDPSFTSTKATVYDPRGIALGEGPMVAEEYRQPKAFKTGYAVAMFMQPLKISNNYGRTMTSVN